MGKIEPILYSRKNAYNQNSENVSFNPIPCRNSGASIFNRLRISDYYNRIPTTNRITIDIEDKTAGETRKGLRYCF